MFGASTVIIEKDKKFSESCLWALQREYFHTEGIDAWVNMFLSMSPVILF